VLVHAVQQFFCDVDGKIDAVLSNLGIEDGRGAAPAFSVVRHVRRPRICMTVFVLHALPQMARLHTLDLSGMRLRKDDLARLGSALHATPRLVHLLLAMCGIAAQGCGVLLRAAARLPTLVTLDLGENRIGNGGCEALCKAVCEGRYPSLAVLIVRCNRLGFMAGAKLLETLDAAPALRQVDLRGNPGCSSSATEAIRQRLVARGGSGLVSTSHRSDRGSD
jgi:Ran GTPase-activating protein (RanGAP) involved in mRNA processing and transport